MSASLLIIDWSCSGLDHRAGKCGAYMVVGVWDIDRDELGEIVFPESWSNALLQQIVAGDDVSHICEMRSAPRQEQIVKRGVPSKTSLISPGGDSSRKLETA